MGQRAIYTPLAQRMRITLHSVANLLFGDVLSPNAGISQEETLLGSEAIQILQRLLGHGILERAQGHLQSSVVSQVLTQRETAVGMQARQYLYSVKEVSIHVGTLVKSLCVVGSPPVLHVAIGVILTTLVIETVCHFVANHYSDSAIVERIVGLGVEEWILKNARREADFIGCRVIISVNRLWSHEPFVLINGLTGSLFYDFVHLKLTTSQHILVE